MNAKETEVLRLIKENPFISQSELSKKIGLTSASVSRIISDLVKKEYITGQAYVLNEEFPIVCIGAANLDRKFFVHNELIYGTSNPIHSAHSVGGVVRNIAENLGRLGQKILTGQMAPAVPSMELWLLMPARRSCQDFMK